MEKNYRKIEFGLGDVDSAIKELNSYNELVCGYFNGVMLYSDVDDINSAYKKVTGKTKVEFDCDRKKENDRYNEEKRKHEESIPNLTIEWIEKGKKILDKKYHKLWIKCVPIRLGDLYRGMELGNCLEIVEQLNKGAEFEEVKPLIENQGHSGMSFGLVCSMISSFCDRGKEFVDCVK